MKKNQIVAVLVTFLLYSSTSNALSFTETTDFPNGGSFDPSLSVSVGVLDTGMNTVSGSLLGYCQAGTPTGVNCNPSPFVNDNQDSFLIEIPDGSMLDSLYITTSNVSGPTDFSASFEFKIKTGPTSTFGTGMDLVLDSTTADFVAYSSSVLTGQGLYPINSGIYLLTIYGQSASQEGAYSFDYAVEANLAPVPIPAAVWLFGSALLGLVGIGRRRSLS